MRKAIAKALIVQSIYNFSAGKPWISDLRGKKHNSYISSSSNYKAKGM
jgi:hypothetical protein